MIARHRIPRGHQGRRTERGTVLVLTALSMAAIVLVTAIVIDLGYTRGGASFDQTNADLAALASGDALARRDYPGACTDIVSYVNINARTSFDPDDLCAGWDNTVCSGGGTSQVTPSATSGRYSLELRFPVPDAEITDPSYGTGKLDGLPCERITVTVSSKEPSFFGGIAGKEGYDITRSATVRGGASQTPVVPALWLLDPVGCPALTVQGGSNVTAGDLSDPANPVAGVITLDSTGTDSRCSTSNTTLTVGGAGTQVRSLPTTLTNGKLGSINLRAMPGGTATCTGTTACNQSDVSNVGLVFPQPTPSSERATRAPVDWEWNCKSSYPAYRTVPIAPCPYEDLNGPYVDNLKAAIPAGGAPTDGTWNRWRASHSCNPAGNITVSGNWLIDCAGGLTINNGSTVTFSGGNVLFRGGLKLLNGGRVNVNTANPAAALPASCLPPDDTLPCIGDSAATSAWIYFARGDLEFGGGVFNANHTTVYLSDTSVVKGSGGSPPAWTSPSEGPFTGLALWAEAPGAFTLAGGSGVSLQGTFFTPNADEMTLTGGGNWGQQFAQFISYRLKVTGGSNLTLSPDPTAAVQLPPQAATLIR